MVVPNNTFRNWPESLIGCRVSWLRDSIQGRGPGEANGRLFCSSPLIPTLPSTWGGTRGFCSSRGSYSNRFFSHYCSPLWGQYRSLVDFCLNNTLTFASRAMQFRNRKGTIFLSLSCPEQSPRKVCPPQSLFYSPVPPSLVVSDSRGYKEIFPCSCLPFLSPLTKAGAQAQGQCTAPISDICADCHSPASLLGLPGFLLPFYQHLTPLSSHSSSKFCNIYLGPTFLF